MMAKKKKKEIFAFQELSPKAQEKAISNFRYKEETWHDWDSEDLTEQFKQILDEDYGLGKDFKVYWSLSYSQGDGVCFEGWIDLGKFIEKKKLRDRFGVLLPYVYAKVSNRNGRYCHYNTMSLEYEAQGVDFRDFMPENTLKQFDVWDDENRRIERTNERRIEAYRQAMSDPQKAWAHAMEAWKARRGSGVKAWIPEPPPEAVTPIIKPPELLEEIPMPDHVEHDVQAAEERAKYVEERLSEEFRVYLEEEIENVSKHLEKVGYEEIDYRSSDEYIKGELLENPSYEDREYAEDGSLAED